MTEDNNNSQNKSKKPEVKKDVIPTLDFSSILLPFYTQALIKLGQIIDPVTKKGDVNLKLSKRLIDLLELLKDRTRGNLKFDEDKILNTFLYQLKAIYLEKSNIKTT